MASILHLIGEILDKTLNTNSVHMALSGAQRQQRPMSDILLRRAQVDALKMAISRPALFLYY